MAADWPGHRAGNDKIVLAAEGIGSKQAAHDLEQPFHTMPIRRSGKLAPHPLGEGAEVIFDIFPGQRLRPGAQRHLARKRQTSETDQLLVFDKDAVQRDSPAPRQARRRVDRCAGFRRGVERNDDAFDPLCHEWLGVMSGWASVGLGNAVLRASSEALAAKASSRAAMRWLMVPAG